MLLKIGNKNIEVSTKILQPEISKSTGKDLGKFSFNIELKGDKSKSSFLNLLKNSEKDGIYSIDEKGNILKKYKVVNRSYSYTGHKISDDTIFNFNVELKEIEELKIESLIISGIEFSPYEYTERFDKDSLIIKAKVKSLASKIDKLIKKTKKETYFTVIRKGISSEPKTMRFGKTVWSKHGNFIKYDFLLVDKTYDDKKSKFKGFYNHEIDNMQDLLAYISNYVEELTDLLVDKKAFSAKEIEVVKNKAKKRQSEKIREFYRVKDIDL